ncbi:MAG: hypothetical protein JW703_04115 [Candidatus Diapherotrites archaeon]|nr:hypothetical protein [Candidatus Diapherotrites archaeon]
MPLKRKKEGRPLPEKPEDKLWRAEFEKMSLEEHNNKLRELGLDEEDIEEFDETFEKEIKPKEKKK